MSNMDNFTDDQKREIAQGEQFGLDVSVYAKPEYDWFQMEEIRKGLEQRYLIVREALEKLQESE